MTISINQISSGMALRVNGEIFFIMEYQHVKPGKGTAFVRVKLKNVVTGKVLDMTFKTADKLDDVPLEERKMQFLYRSGEELHFMDVSSFEEKIVSAETFGNDLKFLQDQLEVSGYCLNESVLNVSLPNFIETEIIETEPGYKGDTAQGGTKPATIDTGAVIQVPLFIDIGDQIKVDTRSGEYVERLKK